MLVDTKLLIVPKTNSHVPLQKETNSRLKLFSAYLAQSQEGDCHEREDKVTRFIFYEEPFSETMNFKTLVAFNRKIVIFFLRKNMYVRFFVANVCSR